MPIVRCVLTRESLDEAIAKVKEYRDRVEKLDAAVVKRLVDDGVEQAQELVPVDTGALMSSIVGEKNGNKGAVKTMSGYAAFVEFGTGVIGAANAYPGPLPAEYKYMGGEHHIITKDGRDGWFYPLDDGTWRFTQGQPTKPFMYDTAQLLANAVPDVVAEEIKA